MSLSNIQYAQWLNAATGGMNSFVKVGADVYDAQLGSDWQKRVPGVPTGLEQHGYPCLQLYVDTCWGLREAAANQITAAKLADELVAKGLLPNRVTDLRGALRRYEGGPKLDALIAQVRAEMVPPAPAKPIIEVPEIPTGLEKHGYPGLKLYVDTCWGLREASDMQFKAGRLADELHVQKVLPQFVSELRTALRQDLPDFKLVEIIARARAAAAKL